MDIEEILSEARPMEQDVVPMAVAEPLEIMSPPLKKRKRAKSTTLITELGMCI
jgi:hypothetical protein